MALFKNTYSGLITGGLGLPACCGLITMSFHVFKCTIQVISGEKGGGGPGGTTAEFLVPFPDKLRQTTRMVLITVKVGEYSWRKSYVVLREKAEIIVKAIDFINTTKDKMYVGVSSIKKTAKRVTAVFRRDDK